MFGTEDNLDESILQKIENVLDRKITLSSLDKLISAIDPKERPFQITDKEKVAIGIDSSAFLKLATNKNSPDIIDYLKTKHTGPIILPGQTIQEFWNNNLTAIQTLSTKFQLKLENFNKELLELSTDFGDFSSNLQELIDNFKNEYGHIYDQKSIRSISNMLDALKSKASTPYVPRTRFYNIARSRKLTKTPPGFLDDGDGDFYVWVEFLYGVMTAQKMQLDFTKAIFLTYDKKKDWSRGNIAHPILQAEITALTGVPIEFWDLEQFYRVYAP